jgi:hypothetical protein
LPDPRGTGTRQMQHEANHTEVPAGRTIRPVTSPGPAETGRRPDNRGLKRRHALPVHLTRSLHEYAPAEYGAPPMPPKFAAA